MTKEQYKAFINDIKADIDDKVLKLTDTIQVLKDETEGIMDWYYDHETMMSMYEFNCIDASQEEINEISEEKEFYLQDKPSLVEVTVADFLKEVDPNGKYSSDKPAKKKPRKKK